MIRDSGSEGMERKAGPEDDVQRTCHFSMKSRSISLSLHTVAFRVSPEEAEQLNRFVRLSGLSKQDYLIRRILHQEVTVIGSSRVYKALRGQMAITLAELKRIEAGQAVDDELMDVIRMMTVILGEMKKEEV